MDWNMFERRLPNVDLTKEIRAFISWALYIKVSGMNNADITMHNAHITEGYMEQINNGDRI